MSYRGKGYSPFAINKSNYPLDKAVQSDKVLSAVFPIWIWRLGAKSIGEFSTQDLESQKMSYKRLLRIFFEMIIMCLVVPVFREIPNPNAINSENGEEIEAEDAEDEPDEEEQSNEDTSDVSSEQGEPSRPKKKRRVIREDDEEDNDEPEVPIERESNAGSSRKRKNKNKDKPKGSKAKKSRNDDKEKSKDNKTIIVHEPYLWYEETLPDGTVEKRKRFHLWIEWLVSEESDNLSDLCNDRNVVGIRINIVCKDPKFDFRENLVHQIRSSAAAHNRPPPKIKDKQNYYKRDIHYIDKNPVLATGYEKLTNVAVVNQILAVYAGTSGDEINMETENMSISQMMEALSMHVFEPDVVQEKLRQLNVCQRQRQPILREYEPIYKLNDYSNGAGLYAQLPIPACGIEVFHNLSNMGYHVMNKEFPWNTLEFFLNRMDDIVHVHEIHEKLLVEKVASQIIDESNSFGYITRGGPRNPNEHEFLYIRDDFKHRVERGVTEHLQKQLLSEARKAFNIERVLPNSVIEGIKLQQSEFPSLVQQTRLITDSVGIFGNMIIFQMKAISSFKKLAHEGLLAIMTTTCMLAAMSDRKFLRFHIILIGHSGTSKSFIMEITTNFCPKWITTETYSSSGSDNVDNMGDSNNSIIYRDECPPIFMTDREKLKPSDHARVTAAMSAMTSNNRTTIRNSKSTDPHTQENIYTQKITEGPESKVIFTGTNQTPRNPNYLDRLRAIWVSIGATNEEESVTAFMGQESDELADKFNDKRLCDYFKAMFLCSMYTHKLITIGLLPEICTSMIKFYARKMYAVLRETVPDVDTKVRCYQRTIELYVCYVMSYAYRCTFGDDMSKFSNVVQSIQDGYTVKNEPFDLEQILHMKNYFVPNEDIAIFACTQQLSELVDPSLSRVIDLIMDLGCDLEPLILSQWIRYAEYMIPYQNFKDKKREAKKSDCYFYKKENLKKQGMDVYCEYAERNGPQLFQLPCTYDANNQAVFHDTFLTNSGESRHPWKELVCKDYNGITHSDTCRNCKDFTYCIPRLPTFGLFASSGTNEHPNPKEGKTIEFLTETKSTGTWINVNYVKVKAKGVKTPEQLANFIFSKQNKQGHSAVSQQEIMRFVRMLTNDKMYVNTHWFDELERLETMSEYKLARLYTPTNLSRIKRNPIKPILIMNDQLYILTTLASMFDYRRLEKGFLDSLRSQHTRPREVLLGRTEFDNPQQIATYHLKKRQNVELEAFNPSAMSEDMQETMEELGFLTANNRPKTVVNKDHEEFFAEDYCDTNNIRLPHYLPSKVEERLINTYNTKPNLQKINKIRQRNKYPTHFVNKFQ